MFKLVLKDFKLSTKAILFIMFYIIVLSMTTLSTSDKLFMGVTYVLLMIMSVVILVIYTNGLDEKNKAEVVLNSFPLNRSDIVGAKYLTLILYTIIICGMLFLSSNLLKELVTKFQGGESVSIGNIIVAINITLLFYSIYYPIYFKIGADIKTFNIVLWILVFGGPAIVGKLIRILEANGMLDKILSIDLNKINVFILIMSLVLYYISLQISKKVYNQREF